MKECTVQLIIGAFMFATAALAFVLKPTIRIDQHESSFLLEQLVPRTFSGWREDLSANVGVINPDVDRAVRKTYTQTLTRTYVNDSHERVMLSIAYGRDQGGETTQSHRPEICYAAQGFLINKTYSEDLHLAGRTVMVRRVSTIRGSRNEPLTYWMTVGDKATLPGLNRKLVQLSYGLNGKIADGMLVRVSSIQNNDLEAYKLQDLFIEEMLSNMDINQTARILGRLP